MNDKRPQLALVTGASSGVGVEFARQLAQRGFDLVLTARRMERLQALREEIVEAYDRHVELIYCDLASPDGAERLVDSTSHLQIDFLINNAGLGIYRRTLDHTIEEIDRMIQVNSRSLSVLTTLFARKMVAAGAGRILNHASIAGIHPSPWYSVYSGTKAYVVNFSTTIHHELKGTGVTVTTLCPGFFRSEFQQKSGREPGAFGKKMILNADFIARTGIEGALRGRSLVIPGLKYKTLNFLVRLFPRSLTMPVADWMVHQ